MMQTFVVLNGNYALEAGYTVAKDALVYEKSDSEAKKDICKHHCSKKKETRITRGIKELVKVLKSDDIKKYINDTYDGQLSHLKNKILDFLRQAD